MIWKANTECLRWALACDAFNDDDEDEIMLLIKTYKLYSNWYQITYYMHDCCSFELSPATSPNNSSAIFKFPYIFLI